MIDQVFCFRLLGKSEISRHFVLRTLQHFNDLADLRCVSLALLLLLVAVFVVVLCLRRCTSTQLKFEQSPESETICHSVKSSGSQTPGDLGTPSWNYKKKIEVAATADRPPPSPCSAASQTTLSSSSPKPSSSSRQGSQ